MKYPDADELRGRMRLSTKRHNDLVKRIADTMNGKIFFRAPFDIVTTEGQFFEVKVSKWHHRTQGSFVRFGMSEEATRFMEVIKNNYFVILVVDEELYLIDFGELNEWSQRVSWRTGFGGIRMKSIELSPKRLLSLKKVAKLRDLSCGMWEKLENNENKTQKP